MKFRNERLEPEGYLEERLCSAVCGSYAPPLYLFVELMNLPIPEELSQHYKKCYYHYVDLLEPYQQKLVDYWRSQGIDVTREEFLAEFTKRFQKYALGFLVGHLENPETLQDALVILNGKVYKVVKLAEAEDVNKVLESIREEYRVFAKGALESAIMQYKERIRELEDELRKTRELPYIHPELIAHRFYVYNNPQDTSGFRVGKRVRLKVTHVYDRNCLYRLETPVEYRGTVEAFYHRGCLKCIFSSLRDTDDELHPHVSSEHEVCLGEAATVIYCPDKPWYSCADRSWSHTVPSLFREIFKTLSVINVESTYRTPKWLREFIKEIDNCVVKPEVELWTGEEWRTNTGEPDVESEDWIEEEEWGEEEEEEEW